MNKPQLNRVFVLVAATILTLSLVATVVAPAQSGEEQAVSYQKTVPDVKAFDPPDEAGVATVDGENFTSIQTALRHAESGETVSLSGRFDSDVTVETANITITSHPGSWGYINGTGEGDVLTVNGPNATLDGIWVANSGPNPTNNDAAIWLNSSNATVRDSRITHSIFGIWVDGVNNAYLHNNTIVGRTDIELLSYRGNGIQLWKTDGSEVYDNYITLVRDGVYYSWASNTDVRRNVLWDLRYGVHYMYSDHNLLKNNVAFDNDVGFALMISEYLRIENNTAVNNSGMSGHGIMIKTIEHSVLTGNDVVGNKKGYYVYNSYNNTVLDGVVMENTMGIHLTAGSNLEAVYGNTFLNNEMPVFAVTGTHQYKWNQSGAEYGNYWSRAPVSDPNNDGISEMRYRPAGLAEMLNAKHPQTIVFTNSPAFDAIRMAESSFPVIEAPGIIDMHPLMEPPHDRWHEYYSESENVTAIPMNNRSQIGDSAA